MNTSENHYIFRVKDLWAGYGSNRKQNIVVKKFSFDLPGGTMTALLGKNGCGKTTLLKAVIGLLPARGDCFLEQQEIRRLSNRERARLVSYIPQRCGVTISLPAVEVVLMGFHSRLGLLQNPTRVQRQAALEALEQVGLQGMEEKDFQTLSEGQRQLCILARTMVEDTRLLLLDEPDSALDFSNRYRMLKLLKSMVAGKDKAGLVCLHDPNLALQICDQVILMKDGGCMEILYPGRDSLEKMNAGLHQIYGDVRLEECQGFPVLLPEEECK